MKIVHIAAEIAPIAKVGGLGDVITGLSRALLSEGHEVEVILPRYPFLTIPAIIDGIPIRTIEIEGDQIYGCQNDAHRFTQFAKKAAKIIGHYDVVHLHDWHTAIVAALLPRTVLTIHNFAYQGECDQNILERAGVKDIEPFKEGGRFNLLKGGIHFANQVTTVSPTYAKEISKEPLIKPYRQKFSGILNGIDTSYWTPETDPYLPHHFSSSDLSGKKKMQALVRKRFDLCDSSPIVGAITRLVPQKSPDLIRSAIYKTRELDGQFILLGSALDPEIQEEFTALKQEFKQDRHVHLELRYDEELSHQVYAASDCFIVPSRFEPCGLTQLIAMRYGAVPIVRKTGGLADTIFEKKNGLLFKKASSRQMDDVLVRAFDLFRSHPQAFEKLRSFGLHSQLGWKIPANNYLEIYLYVSSSL